MSIKIEEVTSPSNNAESCNMQDAALTTDLGQTGGLCNHVEKAALIGLALHLGEKKSCKIAPKEVAAMALAYYLATEKSANKVQPAVRVYPVASAWAFKGFMMRQVPNRIIRHNRFNQAHF